MPAAKATKSRSGTRPEHPPYTDMIKEAIVTLKDRKGSSRQAIKKYIVANYTVPEDIVNRHIKAALGRGVESGLFVLQNGPSGTVKLSRKAKEAKPKVKAPPETTTTAEKPTAKKAAAPTKTKAKPKTTATKKASSTAAKKATASTGTKQKASPSPSPPAAKKPAAKKTATSTKKTTAAKSKTTAAKSKASAPKKSATKKKA
ncbi:hypothetical protein IWQ61_009049 [Dispira simplex]|nr:hypothetical protein IWQ61_009049 [Dispira simplex]